MGTSGAQTEGLSPDFLRRAVAYFDLHGPMLVACPSANSARVLKDSKLSMSYYDNLDADEVSGSQPDLTFNSFVSCYHKGVNFSNADQIAEGIQRLGRRKQWVVTCRNITRCSEISSHLRLDVDHRVLFLNTDSGDVTESFVVNGALRENVLSNINQASSTKMRLDVGATPNKRRSDLGGKELTVVTEDQAPNVFIKERAEPAKVTTPSGDVLEAVPAEDLGGAVVEVLRHLESDLNFTSAVFRRQDRTWGSQVTEGGEIRWTGMVATLHKKEADLAATSLTNIFYR